MTGVVASEGVAEVKVPLKFPTGTWKLRPDPIARADFAIPRGSVTLSREGSKLAAANLGFTIPADTEYADCPFPKMTEMRLIGTVIVPRQKVPKEAELTTTAWEGWRRAQLRAGSDLYSARVYFFFPGNAYGPPEHAPGPLFSVEVGGCQYRAALQPGRRFPTDRVG